MRTPDTSVQLGFRLVKRRFVGRFRRAVGPVEVVALLNVVLLLGMFWLAGSRLVLRPGVRVELPEAPFLEGAPYGTRVVTLTGEGLCFYEDSPLAPDALEARLLAENDPSPLVLLADARTPYGRLMEVYAMAVRAGIREISLGTRPPPRLALPSGRALPVPPAEERP